MIVTQPQPTELEVRALLDGIFERYGFDFRNYALASMRRRLASFATAERVTSVRDFRARVLGDAKCMGRLLIALTVHVTSMFRDPGFYLAFRTKVVPLLKSYPFVRVWHAGCSTGEEIYSMAILLQEEGLYDRCRIYATDMSESVLRAATDGIFPLAAMRAHTRNYLAAGGTRSFSEYYTANYGGARFKPHLREKIVFSAYNLVSEGSFNEFNVILCRNVMIYFNRELQNHVFRTLHGSLAPLGVLGLGRTESIRFSPHEASYEAIEERERIYQRIH